MAAKKRKAKAIQEVESSSQEISATEGADAAIAASDNVAQVSGETAATPTEEQPASEIAEKTPELGETSQEAVVEQVEDSQPEAAQPAENSEETKADAGEVSALEADSPEAQPAEANAEEASAEVEPASDAGETAPEVVGGEPAPEVQATEETKPASEEAEAESSQPSFQFPLENVVEALLISATEPMTLKRLCQMAGKKTKPAVIEDAVARLNKSYADTNRTFEIIRIGETFQIMTLPEYAGILSSGKPQVEEAKKLSPATLDTLAIIAYRQPVMRTEVETIRGVGCGPTLRSLIELGLVEVVGRKEEVVGQPLLYGTSARFLEVFGLASIESLPNVEELRKASLGQS